MAKVAMMTNGLKHRHTYEEVIEYIKNDKDKIKYPSREATKLRKNYLLKVEIDQN